jgi:hypothetical protein
MSGLRILPTLALLAAFAACGEAPDTAAVPDWVEDVAAAANAIEERPTAVDSILQASGMTRVVFDSLIYEVAADPELTAAYEEARGR